MSDESTPNDGTPRVTGETPVVRAVNDVPADVLDELTTAFEKHSLEGTDAAVAPTAPRTAPAASSGDTETVLIDGFDLVSDDELTVARRPPLVIEDAELTGPVLRPEDGDADSDGVVRGAGRFRLRPHRGSPRRAAPSAIRRPPAPSRQARRPRHGPFAGSPAPPIRSA